ncbi:HTH-type transcriptional regulator RutR [Caulobacter segnis]|uniref:Transcriptional regulator, TetR family n=2 Tax=Caulobacter segnis TaxID=88688 RepID=D5VGV0_CAUST|nr:HTH-type transcriptional regulator RutR [Caulobacter segnis]ADG10543.1 transcriptional regulator, TetR family [Caulobacter segnis ATCC 21756]AVQ02261.1 HTH-type transcriptional regulator RutR [Caulobacter segnis]
MTGRIATTVKPPPGARVRPVAKAASGARVLLKAAQSLGEPEAVEAWPRGNRKKAGEARKAAILKGALAVFARLGLDGASVEAIAQASGVSKANLLYYYPSKEALYVAVLEQGLSQWLAPLARFTESDDPADAIRSLIAAKLAMSRDHPEVSRLFALEMLRGAPLLKPVLAGPLKAVFDAKVAVVQAWVATGRLAPVDPPHLIFAIWALTQHYADFAVQVRALSGKSLSDNDFMGETLAAVTGLVLDGVRPR